MLLNEAIYTKTVQEVWGLITCETDYELSGCALQG